MNTGKKNVEIAYENICAIVALMRVCGDAICGKADIDDNRTRIAAKAAAGLAAVVKDESHLDVEDIAKYGAIYCSIIALNENTKI